MPPRRLAAVGAPAGLGLLAALEASLDGTGPALLPLPPDAGQARAVVAALRPDDPAAPPESDDVALVVPTTGSTGAPKGALLTAAALRASAAATAARLGGAGQWLLALPLTHVAGLQVLVRSLLAGTTPVALDPGFDPAAFAAATARLAPAQRRYTALVPTQLARLLDADADAAAASALATYDAVLLGGAATPARLLERAAQAGVRVVTTYGMSETCGGCVYDGRPLDGVRVAVGAAGLVRLGGPVLFTGYRLRPDLTAAALVDGELVTQDLGRFAADGRLEVLGRADDIVVSGGENVALPRVEAALGAHPAVRAAAALGVPDPTWGARVVAVVVPRAATAPTLAELRTWVGERAGRAAAPSELVVVPELPLAGPGKVDRRRLLAELAELVASPAASPAGR